MSRPLRSKIDASASFTLTTLARHLSLVFLALLLYTVFSHVTLCGGATPLFCANKDSLDTHFGYFQVGVDLFVIALNNGVEALIWLINNHPTTLLYSSLAVSVSGILFCLCK